MPTIEKDKREEEIEKSRRRRGSACGQATKDTAKGKAGAFH